MKIFEASQFLGHISCFLLNLYYIPSNKPSTIIATADKYKGFKPAPAKKVAFNTILILTNLLLRIRQAKA